jgi:hypothetical protein
MAGRAATAGTPLDMGADRKRDVALTGLGGV